MHAVRAAHLRRGLKPTAEVGPLGLAKDAATHLLVELHARHARYALCTMCIGVGQGFALLLERV